MLRILESFIEQLPDIHRVSCNNEFVWHMANIGFDMMFGSALHKLLPLPKYTQIALIHAKHIGSQDLLRTSLPAPDKHQTT